ncbi:hypothetical protein HDV01_007429 [Terramyces sp. JEL0728]|nr:hypothetical protein HDV01_007429 [Terramyces sp. JEL0728]
MLDVQKHLDPLSTGEKGIRAILGSKMMALDDNTPLGTYQKKITLAGLLGQDVLQIAIAYYNLNASRVNFTWIAYIRVGFSGIKLSYSFANFISLYAKKKHRIFVKIILFLAFAALAFALSYVIPKLLVLYNDGISVRYLQITTTMQTCYRFANVTANMQSHMVGYFQQDTCSYGTNTTKCPLFKMLDLSKAPASSIVTNAPTSFHSNYYFSPVYEAYLANSRLTETLLFENQDTPTSTLCGNSGIFYPDNVHITYAQLDHIYLSTNNWESLSAFLKVPKIRNGDIQGVLYAQYNDSVTGDAYFAVGKVDFQMTDICMLSK